MKLRGREVKIDKKVLAKAVGIMCLSWAALPIIYYLLIKREKKEVKEDDREK